jgi:hypothetical protein
MKALDTDSLEIVITEETVSFPWFKMPEEGSWEAAAYTHLASALCEMAKAAKRVTATEKETESEKYSFRCFLLRLGFVGAQFKHERAVLMKNLSGHAAFKTLASREPISCKKLYSQPYTMKQYARLLFAFNDMPKIKGGHANMRRWLLVKFDVRISEEQADLDLEEKLARELSGIMNLVLDVLPELLERKKFSKSEAMEQAVRELEIGNDDVLQFVEDRCETNTSALTKGTELFKAFCEYCQQNKLPEITIREFYRRLEEKYQSKPDGHQKAFNIKVVRYE